MKQKKKRSPSSKEPQTLAEHLHHSKGISPPKRIEGKSAGAAITPRARRQG
jgi:hypothetical protein